PIATARAAAAVIALIVALSVAEIVIAPVPVSTLAAFAMYASRSFAMVLNASATPIATAIDVSPKDAAIEAAPVSALIVDVSVAVRPMLADLIPVEPSTYAPTTAAIRLIALEPAPATPTAPAPPAIATDPARTIASID